MMSQAIRSTRSLPDAAILGCGAVTAAGRNLQDIASKLTQANGVAAATSGVTTCAVEEALLSDKAHDRKLRRADRYVRMAALAAMDAWQQALPITGDVAMDRVGMIMASGLGPHQRGFRFLDGLLDFGDTAASPTDFSHSVHGGPCAYIAGMLELRGPTFSITDFQTGFAQAVQLAQCWLALDRCDHVLVGAAEELGDVLQSVAADFLTEDQSANLGEGSVFLLLGKTSASPSATTISAMTLPQRVDLIAAPQSCFLPHALPLPASVACENRTSFLPVLGHSASALAFETLGCMLAIKFPEVVKRDAVKSAMAYVSLPGVSHDSSPSVTHATLRLTRND